jgi:Holliday junction resolvasome RuvABC endonuclease subunit
MVFKSSDFNMQATASGQQIVRPRDRKPAKESPVLELKPAKIVLAIDPSIRNCGWAILLAPGTRKDSGCWHPSEMHGMPDRFVQLERFLAELVHAHKPLAAIVEAPNRGGLHRQKEFSRKSQITYGRAVATIDTTLRLLIGTVYSPDVNDWKGFGSKMQMELYVRARCGYSPRDDNEADAIGLGLWFMSRTSPPHRFTPALA